MRGGRTGYHRISGASVGRTAIHIVAAIPVAGGSREGRIPVMTAIDFSNGRGGVRHPMPELWDLLDQVRGSELPVLSIWDLVLCDEANGKRWWSPSPPPIQVVLQWNNPQRYRTGTGRGGNASVKFNPVGAGLSSAWISRKGANCAITDCTAGKINRT